MKNVLTGCGIVSAIGLVFAVIVGLVVMGYYNKETALRNQFAAQEKANEVVFDQVWKTISQQAQVTDEYKNGFRQVWAEIAKGTGGGQAALQVFVNRHNPQFTPALHMKLMNSIESQRKEFTNNQKKLIDIKREHQNLRTAFPSRFFVGHRPELELHIVTSDRTTEVFRTGKDNDVQLGPKPTK